MGEENTLIIRKEKILTKAVSWVKKPHNLALVGILALALIIRLYYFFLTKDQALWWDAASYGALAKNMIHHQWDNLLIIVSETAIRPLFLPVIWSILMRLGSTEFVSKFIIEIIPSVLSVFFIYKVGEKMYNKRIALISAAILAISWMHIFYSMRMLTSIPALFFSIVSVYFFFISTESSKIKTKPFAWAIFFLFLAILMRYSFAVVGAAYLLSLLFTKRLSFLKQKSFWIGGLIGMIPLFLFFIINQIKYGSVFPALGIYAASAGEKTAYAMYAPKFISHILQTPYYWLFLLGLVVIIAQLVIGFDLINKVKKLKSHIFLILLLAINLAFLMFFIKYAEDRYLFECFVSIILVASLGLDFIYRLIKKHSKHLAVLALIILLLLGGYYQFQFGDAMTKGKKESFIQLKQAFQWVKDNTPEDSRILSSGTDPWTLYYGERTQVRFEENLSKSPPYPFDYIMIQGINPQSEALIPYTQAIESRLTPVAQILVSPQQQEPIIWIFRVNH